MRDAPPKSQLRFRFLFFEASTTWAKYENHDVFTDLAIAGIGTYSNKKYVCISSILSVVFASKRLPNRKIHHHHWGLSSLSSFLSFPNLQGSTEVLQLSLVYIRGWYFEGDLSNSLRKHGLCWLLQVWMFISRNFTIKNLRCLSRWPRWDHLHGVKRETKFRCQKNMCISASHHLHTLIRLICRCLQPLRSTGERFPTFLFLQRRQQHLTSAELSTPMCFERSSKKTPHLTQK